MKNFVLRLGLILLFPIPPVLAVIDIAPTMAKSRIKPATISHIECEVYMIFTKLEKSESGVAKKGGLERERC